MIDRSRFYTTASILVSYQPTVVRQFRLNKAVKPFFEALKTSGMVLSEDAQRKGAIDLSLTGIASPTSVRSSETPASEDIDPFVKYMKDKEKHGTFQFREDNFL